MRSKTRIDVTQYGSRKRRYLVLPTVGIHELHDALNKCNGNVTATAQYLGVHRSTVYRLLARYGIVGFLNVQP